MTATKKRTARSASTRSTLQESIDKAQIKNLQRVVDEMHGLAQRHLAQSEAHLRRAEAAEAVIRMRDSRISAMFGLLIKTRAEISRKEGYIDRVRETDSSVTPVRNPILGEADPFLMDNLRTAMAEADEGTFDRIVSSMSDEELNKVMGKNPNEQSDILR